VRIFIPPFLCLTPMLLRGAAAAAGLALVNTVFSVGGFVGPSLVGWFKDATGSTSGAFLILAALSLGAAVPASCCGAIPCLRRAPGLPGTP